MHNPTAPKVSAIAQTPISSEIDRLLNEAPSYHKLDAATQDKLRRSLAEIATALSTTPSALTQSPLAGALAPDLRSRLSPRPVQPTQPVAGGGNGSQQTAQATRGQAGVTGRVGEVARATLNAIGFPEFVASLIQGTFQAIVDASIQQMEAYAELLNSVAGTVDQFMRENISSGMAQDYVADQYQGMFAKDFTGDQPTLVLNRNQASSDEELPSFFKDLGFDTTNDIQDDDIEAVIVPAARRSLAEMRQQTLATMVLMGMNRIVVDDGEINAKLQFHIDATETTELKFDQTKVTRGNMAGTAGRSQFTANAIMVNTTSLNAQSDINVRTDLTGQVKVRFRSDYFPLARFADTAAIQLINSRAHVPQAQPVAQQGTVPAPAIQVPQVAIPATPAVPATPTTPTPAPVSQSLATNETDPWLPRVRR